MKERSIFLFLERMWLFAALFSAVVCAWFAYSKDTGSALYFFGLFALSSLFYFLRKRQRKRREQKKHK